MLLQGLRNPHKHVNNDTGWRLGYALGCTVLYSIVPCNVLYIPWDVLYSTVLY